MLYVGEKKNPIHVCLRGLPKNFLPIVDTQHQAHLSVFPAYNSVLLYPFQPCHYLLCPLLCEASYKRSDI